MDSTLEKVQYEGNRPLDKFDRIQEYVLSLLFAILLPLFPLFLELWITEDISMKSLSIGASIFSISIGVTSNYKLLFGVSIIISLIYSVLFGLSFSNIDMPAQSELSAKISIGLLATLNGIERYFIHYKNSNRFWRF